MSGFWRMAPWMLGFAAILLAGPAAAQGNLDAGKTPAQIFSDTCASCHRSPAQVRRASASFLRSHYTTGREEASAMARYLANVPNEPRPAAAQKKGASPKETPGEAAARRAEPKEQAKGPAGSSKGRRADTAEAKSTASASAAATPEAKPPEAPAESAPPPPPPAPALEPFEE